MGFEKVVLNRVEQVLGESRRACFFNGTLFVECSAETSQQVLDALSLTYGPVEIAGPIAGEFAYDFV
jgi:hypothetical protein